MSTSSVEVAAGKIFLCYRREDSAGHAGRVYDRLNRRFPGRVFMDVAGIGIGTRWAEVIERTLGSCDVAVILIGRRWLERDAAGTRRIDDPADALRAEITTALRLKLRIVPLLVAGAAVPQLDELPQDLAPLIDWQALRIDDDDFDHDSTRLITALERQLQDEGPDPHLESADAKSSEIRRLLVEAESCIAREDWITAAQTLRAVLSLDKTHAEAMARLQFVQQQTTRAFQVVPMPPPVKRHAGLWMAFGIMGLLGGFGAIIVMIVLIVQMMAADKKQARVVSKAGKPPVVKDVVAAAPASSPHRTGGTDPEKGDPASAPRPSSKATADPQSRPSSKAPAPPPPPASPGPTDPQMAGEYKLISYVLQGVAIPVSGSLRLVPVSDGHFRFEMSLTHASVGEYRYSGRFEGQDSNWTMTTEESSDPKVIKAPVPAQVSFDGSTLGMQNLYATVVWQKHPG